jgi:hypothetical protein
VERRLQREQRHPTQGVPTGQDEAMRSGNTSDSPRRVRVEGDLFHGRVPAGAVYVGRGAPGLPGSPYRNPYQLKRYSRDDAMRLHREYLRADPDLVARARRELAGRDLACWCRLDERCHADILLAVVAGEQP